MSLGNWLRGQIVDESTTIVKTAKSKGPAGKSVTITVADIQRGTVQDSNGYVNEIVLFLKKNKKDR